MFSFPYKFKGNLTEKQVFSIFILYICKTTLRGSQETEKADMEQHKQSVRIQKSIVNAAEKKLLVWLAERQPAWMTSDRMTFIGFLGAVVIALGYTLTNYHYTFLWLASLGFLINWYGDSLDGTLARVRHHQRPVYGFFIDHNVDCINESIMFVGVGLSPFVKLDIALLVLAAYLVLSIYVYINAHLKNEFKLTFAKMGPTEFRIIMILVNTLFIFIRPLREFRQDITLFGHSVQLGILDYIAVVILLFMVIIYLTSLFKDAREYARIDPLDKE